MPTPVVTTPKPIPPKPKRVIRYPTGTRKTGPTYGPGFVAPEKAITPERMFEIEEAELGQQATQETYEKYYKGR